MGNCVFCQIVSGQESCYKIYEDEHYLAFLDKYPIAKGHTLVIPKKHYDLVWDLSDIGAYFQICQKIAKHFQTVTKNKWVTSFILGNEIHHAHIHLVPSIEESAISATIKIAEQKGQALSNEEGQKMAKFLKSD